MMRETALKHPILKGTLVLACAGIITRFLGLYNRVFLANTIDAVQLGLYQMIFPVFMVCNALCCAGIEIALSRWVAAYEAKGDYNNLRCIVRIAVSFSIGLSLFMGICVYLFADPISRYVLKEPLCAPCLKILAPVIVFSTAHSCILGYFYGIKKTSIPAISLLVEQVFRVGGIYIIAICQTPMIEKDARLAVFGMVLGDGISCVFTLAAYAWHMHRHQQCGIGAVYRPVQRKKLFKTLISDAAPITINRLSLNMLQSIEAILMPAMMKHYYSGDGQALEIYGVITGMTMPFIMFPSTITNALASVLMPAVTQAHIAGEKNVIRQTVSKSLHFCFLLGILMVGVFYLYGQYIGTIVFNNEMSGQFLTVFSILCPFIYASSVLSSVLNGMGEMNLVLLHNLISVGIRMAFIVIFVREVGVYGYLAGAVLASVILTFMHGIRIAKAGSLLLYVKKSLVIPLAAIGVCGFISWGVFRQMAMMAMMPLIISVFLSVGICCIFYAATLWVCGCMKL